jgi:nucleotide-binding universal stress UspA family protein
MPKVQQDGAIRDMVLNLSPGTTDDATVDYAVSLAGAFDAHLAAVAFVYEEVPIAMLGDDIAAQWVDGVEELRREAQSAAKAALARFDKLARGAGLSAEARVVETTFTETGEEFGRIARRFDLSLVRQAEPASKLPDNLIIEAALFDTGRPVLIVPYIQKGEARLDRILICWDGSRPAARAIADSLPLLRRAKAVEIVTIGERVKGEETMTGGDITDHLRRHGLSVVTKNIVAPDVDVPSTILSHAADCSADLLVMGGYGHSRLREFVLGGATRGILATMTIPTLMSH